MSRSGARKTVQYHVLHKFSNENKICEAQIIEVFQRYYTDKRNDLLKIKEQEMKQMFGIIEK